MSHLVSEVCHSGQEAKMCWGYLGLGGYERVRLVRLISPFGLPLFGLLEGAAFDPECLPDRIHRTVEKSRLLLAIQLYSQQIGTTYVGSLCSTSLKTQAP